MAGLFRRSLSYLNSPLFKKLFTVLVRHRVWSGNLAPYLKKHINRLEHVKRRVTKLVGGHNILNYAERLKWLDLPSLA